MFGPPSNWEYPTALAAAVVVGTTLFLTRLRAAHIAAHGALAFALALAGGAILGGRLHMLLESDVPWSWSALLESGYRHPGAVAGALLALPIGRRLFLPDVPLARLADCAAPPAAFAMATMRAGCLAAGCCFGTVSHLPWAIRFPMGSLAANLHSTMGWLSPTATASLAVHPLQIYFALLALATGGFLLWFEPRKSYEGEVALLFVALHESGKFLLEFLRAPGLTPQPAIVQMFSLVLAVTAVIALARARTASGYSRT